jgi:hypothetical protein
MNARRSRALLQRRGFIPLVVGLLSSLIVVCGMAASTAQSPVKQEREIEDKIPKRLPIRVKIKKPEKLKDLKNEDWLDDVEIEVTNTGTKPIYFLSIALSLPDVFADDGRSYGYKLRYGRVALADFGEPVRPDDVPLQPGESITLMPPANHMHGWKGLRADKEISNPKKLVFDFQEINFGDGTGFLGSDGGAIPARKERSSNAPCREKDKEVSDAAIAANSPPGYITDLAFLPTHLSPPVGFVLAVFSSKPSSSEPTAKRDICCQTSRPECSFIKPGGQTCHAHSDTSTDLDADARRLRPERAPE